MVSEPVYTFSIFDFGKMWLTFSHIDYYLHFRNRACLDKVLICDRSHTMNVNVWTFAQYAMVMLLMGVFQEHKGLH